MPTNFEKWVNFLNPDNLKGNLMNCSLYIAVFESFNDYVVEEVRMFFNNGFKDGEFTFSPSYTTDVLNRNRSPLIATLMWLQEQGAISDNDLALFEKLKKYRNKLAHEMIELLFEGYFADFPENLSTLMALRITIERWWVINIDIPTNEDFDLR